MDTRKFLGRGLKFPLQVDPKTGKLAMSDHEENIEESVGIILRTGKGERVMRPDFGTDTMDHAFAASAVDVQSAIARELSEALTVQEPRVRDVEVTVDRADRQEGALVINVSYTVRSTNNRYNRVYPFYVTEGSEGGGEE